MKKSSLLKCLLVACAAMPFSAYAEIPKVIFEENKNQWPSQVKFKADIKGGALFMEQNAFTYVLKENINWHKDHRNESGGPVTQKHHAFKVTFENSNPNSEIFGNNRYSWHRNYYIGDDRSKWASNVPVFSQVYYKNLYENIDLQYYNDEANLKYDIIIQPGGNPREIKLNYEGTDGLSIQNGHLFVKTTIYDIIEQKPYAYQEINGNKIQVACAYVLKNNNVIFEVGAYDNTLPLIIDPQLIASTYSGSTADNWGFTATYDAAQNIYMGGIISGTGYPTTLGAWDSTYNGGNSPGSSWPFDIFLAKFNPTGSTLMYATYYGGIINEQPHSLVVNGNNELYVVGRTNSSNFPTLGAYDASLNGGYDIIVGKFNSVGNLLASTFVGGSADDCVNVDIDWNVYGTTKFSYTDDGRSEIIIDANSNVYVAACTKSTDFPLVNAYQGAFGGTQDAVVFKMNSALSALTFSTYLGGAGTDAAYGLKLDNSNNVYVTGGTTGGFPTTASVLHPTYQGGLTDAFIAVLNSTGNTLLRSTYLGTIQYDQSYMIEIDASGDLYVFGQTRGNYPVTSSVYSNPGSGQFIHKLTGNLQNTVFSTVVGNGPSGGFPRVNLSPTAFLVDSCQTIYIAGWGRSSILSGSMPFPSSTTGLPTTTNAYQSATDGKDHYFMVLEPNAKALYYATFFGEGATNPDADHVDGGTCRFDKRGVIYQACCASCGGTQGFPTTPTAYSLTNNSDHINHPFPNSAPQTVYNCNEAVVKMDVSVNPIAVANVTSATTGCAPFTVTFSNTGSVADYYFWDFGDGGTSTLPAPTYTYNFAGTFTITLYATDSIGVCGFDDYDTVIVTVGAAPTLVTTSINIPCIGGTGTATVSPTGGITPYTYAWSPSGGSTNTASFVAPGIYTVSVTDNTGCKSTQTVVITEPPPLTVATATVGATCGLNDGSATASGVGGTPGYSYVWSTGPTTTSVTGLGAGTYSITVTDANGCSNTQSFIVPNTNAPVVIVTTTSVTCNGASTGSACAQLSSGTPPYTYQWSPTSAGTNICATGLTAGNYAVTVYDSSGCFATNTVSVTEANPIAIGITPTHVNCYGTSTGVATAVVSGGTPAFTYSWNTTPVQTVLNASNLASGTYSITVTDANGCTKASSVTITQPASPLALTTTVSGSSCGTNANGVANVTVSSGSGTPPYSYLWSNNATTQVISNLTGGGYTVVVTDSKGCTATSTATMPTSVQPIADFTYAPSITCDGITYHFSSTSTDALTHNWDLGGLSTSTDTNPSIVFPYNGTYNVTLIVSNPPCHDTLTKAITVGDLGSGMVFKEANVFTPNADGLNDCFHPAMINLTTGLPDEVLLPCTFLQVFDRWGVKMYESLGVNGINCWNGNNRNDNKAAPDGTYYWIATLGETTLKGYVTLARHK